MDRIILFALIRRSAKTEKSEKNALRPLPSPEKTAIFVVKLFPTADRVLFAKSNIVRFRIGCVVCAEDLNLLES